MESLLSYLLWVGLMVFIIRIGRDAQSRALERARLLMIGAANAEANHDLRWVPPEKDVDPVCVKTVTTAKAKPSVHDGQIYYFCSRECREVFEAAPHLYEGHRHASQPELGHSHA